MISYCRCTSTSLVKGCIHLSSLQWRLNRHNMPQTTFRLLSCQSGIPNRKDTIEELKKHVFDVLVIGGGAVGCGCALDAASRGLSTALVEANDFASGSSSKSSKLIDGNVSYLSSTIRDKDLQYFRIMRKMLRERAIMMHIAPHLTRPQPMIIPIYSPLKLPFHWLSCKIYDWVAGCSNVKGSHFLSKQATLDEFPLLRPDNLVGSIVYYDVQYDDARMCLALANTAAQQGASIINYMKLEDFVNNDGTSRFMRLKDMLTEEQFFIKARSVINATGAYTDEVRQMSVQNVECISTPSCGTYVVLPKYFSSTRYGLLSPGKDKDSPPLIMLPFQCRTLLGCIDSVDNVKSIDSDVRYVTKTPMPNLEYIQHLLSKTHEHLAADVELSDRHISSAWSGLRTKVNCPCTCEDKSNSPKPVCNYLLEVDQCCMITVAGGRWNTYRQMAKAAVDAAIQVASLSPREMSCTHELLLDGAHKWDERVPLDLVQCYDVPMDVAQHLSDTYGSNAHQLLAETTPTKKRRIHANLPYIGAEVQYACQYEHACHLVDVIARRLRVAFVDAMAAVHVLPCAINIMSKIFDWDEEKKENEILMARDFLCGQMGLGSIIKPKPQFKKKVTVKSESGDGYGKRMKVQGHTRNLTTTEATIWKPVNAREFTAPKISLPPSLPMIEMNADLSYSNLLKIQTWGKKFMC